MSRQVEFDTFLEAQRFADRLDKLLGFPRQGVRVDGKPIPLGEAITVAWALPENSKTLRKVAVMVRGIEELPSRPDLRQRLTSLEAADVEAKMATARDRTAQWGAVGQEDPTPVKKAVVLASQLVTRR